MKKRDNEEIRRQLSFIEEPVQRLQEMLKHGLKQDAERLFLEIVQETKQIYFQRPNRTDGLGRNPRIGERLSQDEFVVCVGKWNNSDIPEFNFDHEGLRQTMGWSRKRIQSFMELVFQRAMATVDPAKIREDGHSWLGSYEAMAAYDALERFIPADHEMRPKAERWCLRSLLFCEVYAWQMYTEWQEKCFARKFGPGRPSLKTIVESFEERFRELGASDDEIREDFLAWLDQIRIHPDWMVDMANARIFRWEDRERRGKVMGKKLEEVMKGFMYSDAYHPALVAKLIDGGLINTRAEEAKRLYRRYTVELLADGRLGRVMELQSMIAHRFFGMVHDPKSRNGRYKVAFDPLECVAQAFDLAWRNDHYGIAAALALQFGEEACLDPKILKKKAKSQIAKGQEADHKELASELIEERKTQIRTAYDLAKTTGKPICLDYRTCYTPSY